MPILSVILVAGFFFINPALSSDICKKTLLVVGEFDSMFAGSPPELSAQIATLFERRCFGGDGFSSLEERDHIKEDYIIHPDQYLVDVWEVRNSMGQWEGTVDVLRSGLAQEFLLELRVQLNSHGIARDARQQISTRLLARIDSFGRAQRERELIQALVE